MASLFLKKHNLLLFLKIHKNIRAINRRWTFFSDFVYLFLFIVKPQNIVGVTKAKFCCVSRCLAVCEQLLLYLCYCLLYLAIYYHFSLEGPLAFKSVTGCLIVEDSLLGPLNCSLGTMDSFVNVFLFLSADNTGGSFWLFALKKCLQNYTS